MDFHLKLGMENEKDVITWVKSIARKLLQRLPSNCFEEDELVAEGLLALAISLSAYDSSRSETFPAYVCIRIKGRMKDFIRKKAERHSLVGTISSLSDCEGGTFEPVAAPRDACPEVQYSKKELRKRLSTAVNSLPELEKTVVIEHAVHGKSHARIARELGKKTRSFTTKALKRVSNSLKESLTENGTREYQDAA